MLAPLLVPRAAYPVMNGGCTPQLHTPFVAQIKRHCQIRMSRAVVASPGTSVSQDQAAPLARTYSSRLVLPWRSSRPFSVRTLMSLWRVRRDIPGQSSWNPAIVSLPCSSACPSASACRLVRLYRWARVSFRIAFSPLFFTSASWVASPSAKNSIQPVKSMLARLTPWRAW